MIGTLIAVAGGTRWSAKRAVKWEARQAGAHASLVAERLVPFHIWLDALSDQDHYAHATHILGQSMGSRFADRGALTYRYALGVTW